METIKQLTPFISVTGQIQPSDMRSIAAQGFVTVINNRPDGETEDQPGTAALATAAQAVGLHYYYLPITAGQITDNNISEFSELMAQVKGPVLVFCRTGTRSCCVWALSEAHRLHSAALVAAAKNVGYDLTNLLPRIEQRWAD